MDPFLFKDCDSTCFFLQKSVFMLLFYPFIPEDVLFLILLWKDREKKATSVSCSHIAASLLWEEACLRSNKEGFFSVFMQGASLCQELIWFKANLLAHLWAPLCRQGWLGYHNSRWNTSESPWCDSTQTKGLGCTEAVEREGGGAAGERTAQ